MRNPTMDDVAREAGVSAKTVSRVINGNDYFSEDTRIRVQNAIEKLNYRPNRSARSLVSNRNTVIGLALPDIAHAYFAEVVAGIERVAQERGYNVLLINTRTEPDRERDAFRLLEEYRVDGLIFNTPTLPNDELVALLRRQKASVVIGHDALGDVCGLVNVDVRSAMIEAVEVLVQAGRSNIAYVKVTPDDRYPTRERLRGYHEAVAALQLPANDDYIVDTAGDFDQTGKTVEALLRSHPEINAIICYNDATALNVIEACDHLGVNIPGDVAIVGFDDIPYSKLHRISLTTFAIPRFELGVAAAKMLFDRMTGTTDSHEIIFRPTFVQRNSTPSRFLTST